MIDKKLIRKNSINKRNKLSQTKINEKSLIIQKKLITLILNKNTKVISSYININSEVITDYANKLFIKKKLTLAIPKITNKEMHFYKIHNYNTELQIGHFSIPEPNINITGKINNSTIELAIIPALAFDKQGNRIGYGKGYFDRFLKQNTKIIKVGIAFDTQIINHITKEKHDQIMDYIITEKETIYINP